MQLNFKQFGQGDPLVILHGLFGTLDNWQTIAKQLAEHYTVFIIDQRNHGRSPHLPEMNYPILAEDLRDFMESQWIYEAHILGHSMGGKTAMQFAVDFPDMVEKLIVVDIAPKAAKGGHEAIYEALLSLDLEKIESRKDADAKLKARIPEFGVRQFLLKNLTRQKEGGYAWKMNLEVLHQHYPDILAEITGDTFEKSTLFVRGGKSNYILDEDIKDIKKLFPAANLETVEEAGHWVHAEAPEKLLGLIQRFLAE